MKRVKTQAEEEVFEEKSEEVIGEEDEEAWGWELVPPEHWEGEGVEGALETPGMPGAKRGEAKAGELFQLMTLEFPHPIPDDSSNPHHIHFYQLICFSEAHIFVCPSIRPLPIHPPIVHPSTHCPPACPLWCSHVVRNLKCVIQCSSSPKHLYHSCVLSFFISIPSSSSSLMFCVYLNDVHRCDLEC